MSAPGHIHLIYDGQCVFCRRALAVFQAIDFGRRIDLVDANDKTAVAGRFPMLTEADTEQAMFSVDGGNKVHRGFYAFRRLIWNSPLTWPLILVFYLPGVPFIGERVYAWVARNRRQMGCKSNVCELPTPLSSHEPPDRSKSP